MTNVTAAPIRLPNEPMRLDSFNLWPGATFVCDPQPDLSLPDEVKDLINPDADEVWVVTHVERDVNDENVHVWARRADIDEYLIRKSFTFDFCDTVSVVGNIVNYNDLGDNNWGSTA